MQLLIEPQDPNKIAHSFQGSVDEFGFEFFYYKIIFYILI